MDTQAMGIMEYKKDTEAADRESIKQQQDNQTIGEVVVETSGDNNNNNNGQAVELEAAQVSANQHHQTAARHQGSAPTHAHAKGLPVASAAASIPQEHTPLSRPPSSTQQQQQQQQQWASKEEERVGIASAGQPITVITAPKTRMINNSGNIREMTAEESEAAERNYERLMNSHAQAQALESNGANSSHAYSGSETLPTTSIATVVASINAPILVTNRGIINEKDQICISNQIIAHPEHSTTTIYHEQVHSEEGEGGYRNEYFTQYNDQRPEHGHVINREGQSVASYVNSYRYVGSPGRVVATTTTELKPIQIEEQQHQVSQEIHIYDESEVVQQNPSMANGQSHLTGENMESKLHYTNLDANYISQEHYPPPYGHASNAAIAKDYIFGAPPNVLYKGEINRNFADAILANHPRPPYLYTPIPMGQHHIYESPSSGSGGPSPSGQPARFHSNQPYLNYEGYNQVVIENEMPTEYQTSWTTSTSSGYEDHGAMTTITTTVSPVTKCIHCGSQTSFHYRTDASGHLVCNSCAARSGVTAPPSSVSRPANRSAKAKTAQTAVNNNRRTGVVCANCNTTTTTLWRRNNSGDPVCNACGLYFKLHNTPRPIAMKKDGVQTRKRKPKNVPINGTAAKCPVREKVLPSMIPPPDPKLGVPNLNEGPAVSSGQEPPPTQHYLPAHSQSGGMPPGIGYILKPVRHASPAVGVTAVDTTRSGVAETTSVITSTGAPSGP